MAVTIKKLTPPQVAAIRETFPINVRAGLVTLTASQATFRDIPGKNPWRVEHVRRVLDHACGADGSCPIDRRDLVANVVKKLDTRPELVVEA